MTWKHGALRRVAFGMPALLALAAHPAHADGDYISPTNERVRISLGAMHVSTASTARADSSSGLVPGNLVNGEDQFGLDRADFEPKFQAVVRVAKRHRFSFDYFTLDRSGNTILTSGPLVFKDVTLLTTDPLQSKANLRTLGVTYGYSFWHTEKIELAGTFGVQETDVSASVRVQSPTRHVFQAQDEAGPVPTVGIDATWVASSRFYADGRARYIKVNINHQGGSLAIYELDALYRYRPNVSFGVGYMQIKARIESHKTTQAYRFDFSTKGPEVFVRIAF